MKNILCILFDYHEITGTLYQDEVIISMDTVISSDKIITYDEASEKLYLFLAESYTKIQKVVDYVVVVVYNQITAKNANKLRMSLIRLGIQRCRVLTVLDAVNIGYFSSIADHGDDRDYYTCIGTLHGISHQLISSDGKVIENLDTIYNNHGLIEALAVRIIGKALISRGKPADKEEYGLLSKKALKTASEIIQNLPSVVFPYKIEIDNFDSIFITEKTMKMVVEKFIAKNLQKEDRIFRNENLSNGPEIIVFGDLFHIPQFLDVLEKWGYKIHDCKNINYHIRGAINFALCLLGAGKYISLLMRNVFCPVTLCTSSGEVEIITSDTSIPHKHMSLIEISKDIETCILLKEMNEPLAFLNLCEPQDTRFELYIDYDVEQKTEIYVKKEKSEEKIYLKMCDDNFEQSCYNYPRLLPKKK